jgi:hypothetical protein
MIRGDRTVQAAVGDLSGSFDFHVSGSEFDRVASVEHDQLSGRIGARREPDRKPAHRRAPVEMGEVRLEHVEDEAVALARIAAGIHSASRAR